MSVHETAASNELTVRDLWSEYANAMLKSVEPLRDDEQVTQEALHDIRVMVDQFEKKLNQQVMVQTEEDKLRRAVLQGTMEYARRLIQEMAVSLEN